MDGPERKFAELQKYRDYLENKIASLKDIKLKQVCPDQKINEKITRLQKIYELLCNPATPKKVSVVTLEKFEEVIKKHKQQDVIDRQFDKLSKNDYAEFHRPGSSCSSTSASSNMDRKKVLDDTPASPSPPRSPAHSSSSESAPKIIPLERRNRYVPIVPMERFFMNRSPTPPRELPRVVPIPKTNMTEIGPLDWDSDNESELVPKSRPTIIVAKHADVGAATKKAINRLPIKEAPKEPPRREEIRPVKWDIEPMSQSSHPSQNVPTVPVSALEGSRRLKTVIEKTNLFGSDINRIISGPHYARSPASDDVPISPNPDFLRQSPVPNPIPPPTVYCPPKPPPSKVPTTPSLLLNAPLTSSEPISIADISEYLDENSLNKAKQPPSVTRPRMQPIPNSSPVMVSPRSDTNIMPPHADPRISSDPRSRPHSNDPRSYNVPPVVNDPRLANSHGPMPSADPRCHSVGSQMDPRSHSTVPLSDPRSHSVAATRYADSYERHKRSQDSGMPSDYQRHQYGQEAVPSMVPPPPSMHGPGPGPGSYGQMGPPNQVGYEYWMGNQPQQHWDGPPSHSHMQPPQSYQMPNQPPGWQQMQPHAMMNGDSRMSHGYPNQMPPNMVRNDPHAQSLMNSNQGYGQNRNPNYQDTRPPYNMPYNQQQQHQPQPRPAWNNRMNDSERFPARPPFGRPNGPPSSWNKDAQRPNRDPRMFSDRDPRTRPEPPQPAAPPVPPKETPAPTKPGPPAGKEVHPNKLKQITEKEVSKKRSEISKPDSIKEKLKEKEKEKQKERDKQKDKDKNKHSEKTKSKSKDKEKERDVIEIYGTIDAKKALQAPGLQKFKIPKKRPSNETKDSTPVPEDSMEENLLIPEKPSKQSEKSTSKKSSKSNEKDKEKKSKKDRDKDKDKDSIMDDLQYIDQIDEVKEFAASNHVSTENVAELIKKLMLKNKNKSLLDDVEEKEVGEKRKPEKKKISKKKKVSKNVIESSDESDAASEKIKGKKKKKVSRKILSDESETDEKEGEANKEKEQPSRAATKSAKSKENKVPDDNEDNNAESAMETESEVPASTDEIAEEEKKDEEETVAPASLVAEEEKIEKAPVKPKPKRRLRELDMLQEDLKSSWICDGAMRATGSRTCSQRNKDSAEQAQEKLSEDSTGSSASGSKNTGKMKKPLPPRAKPGPKSKKAAALSAAAATGAAVAALSEASSASCLGTSDSEDDDTPLARRSENIVAEGKPKKDASSRPGKKARAKSLKAQPPPLFDSSSNDSFNLDASAVEPSTDISLHPETSPPAKAAKGKPRVAKKRKATEDAAVESSSDESVLDNTHAKQRDDNEELLENVMAELASNPKYSVAKKKPAKKKRSNWQMGIVTKKKKKKAAAAGSKVDEAHGSTSDLSVANENDMSVSDSASASSKKANSSADPNESLEKAPNGNESEDSGRSASVTKDDEDVISRVDPEALIGYTQSGNGKYQCLLCTFYRKNIVHHYKTQHPRKEVLISRLPTTESSLALEESSRLDLEHNDPPPDREIGRYICRFCDFMSKGVDSIARETFYEHCSNHTGEYRFMCQQCNYESLTKSSMRTHYYKECRRLSNSKNLNEAMIETPIPSDNRIYGYMCSKCNFVQLKKSNVEKHVRLWHTRINKDVEVRIVKIDMSVSVKREDIISQMMSENTNEPVVQKVEPKDEKDLIASPKVEDFVVKNDLDDSVVKDESEKMSVDDSDISITLETVEHKPERNSNLSAFVCPDELTNKEEEIQNERKKKMQEIAQNIGIKVGREETQKRLSIVDNLYNKFETSQPVEEVETNVDEKMEVEESPPVDESQDPLSIPEPKAAATEENDQEQESQEPIPESVQIKEDPDNAAEKEDKTGGKIKDPLAFVNESPEKPAGSDDEASDGNHNIMGSMEYDSESEQSDHELSTTDMNSLLKDTSEIGSPSKGGVSATIQRLAAQLQTKPPETPPLPVPEMVIADIGDGTTIRVKSEQTSPKKSDDDMAILSPTKIKTEVKDEPKSPSKNSEAKMVDEDSSSQSSTNSPQTKGLIRIRRISGDKLSKGGDQECEVNTETDQTMATLKPIDAQATDEDSNFGFRIESVVSLAPKDSEGQIIPNVHKAVETSPLKSNVSVLKKPPSQYIIKRADGTSRVLTTSTREPFKLVPITMPTPRNIAAKPDNFLSIGGQISIKIDPKTMAPYPSSSSGTSTSSPTTLVTSTGQPIKLVKISPPEHMSLAFKLKPDKTPQQEKLLHMFKCMVRDCNFTSNSEPLFMKHVKTHEDDPAYQADDTKKDYYKCAYCNLDCKNYEELLKHLKAMHIFCRYCCNYCSYRAFAYTYVEIHQKTFHPLKSINILTVSEEHVHIPPASKRLDRKQIIKPYVCVHECNKYFFVPEAFMLHLNMHHKIVSGYKCHVCFGMVSTSDALIEHYKQHGFFKYHCMYCVHGAASIKDLAAHMSTAHYNQPPQILERCLPREISKNMSAIDQLRVRDVDAMCRKPEEDSKPKVTVPTVIKTAPITIIPPPSGKVPRLIAPKETVIPVTTIPSSVSNIRILDARTIPTTSLLNVGNIKLTLAETPKLSNLNTQLLQKSDNVSGKISQIDAKLADNSNDDNDDVVFLEEVSVRPSNTRKDQPEQPASTTEIKEESVESAEDSNNASEQDNSNLSGTSDQAVAAPKPGAVSLKRFVTLDDVKDSGFVGRELFRCGVDNCQFGAETAEELRVHIVKCVPNDEENSISDAALYCVHCGLQSKRFSKPSFFIDHLKIHGLKRFGCSLCDSKFAVQSQAQSHLRAKHKYMSSKIVPADPTNPTADGLFVIYPVAAEKSKGKKGAKSAADKLAEREKTRFLPSEIDKLPLPAIFIKALQCAICGYTNKVRTNIVRHLQAHLKDESVPNACPVNPVPCLDKKERMFDKMVNLASSSHENGRMGGGGSSGSGQKEIKSEEDEALPKFVPENKRYVCGVAECNYLTVDEIMLRHHLKALHSDEVYFRCPHCPPPNGQDPGQNIALEKMGVHLKMHDCRLYKCSYCIYHHYHRHVVERHVSDKHPDKRQVVKVVRELQTDQQASENQQPSGAAVQEPEEDEQPDPDGNTWKCNLCDFKCVLKAAIQNHATTEHNERGQFKCNGCGYNSISKITFDQHMTAKHSNENVDYVTVYRRIKNLKKTDADAPSVLDEPFDTTPLWSRHMPRIRHIRGILLEEEEENETSRGTKRKYNKTSAEDSLKSPESKKRNLSAEDIEKLRTADGGFGPYGTPIGDLFCCTICNTYKSRYKQDFRDHIFRDLKYLRWHCTQCEYMSVNRAIMMKHFNSRHPGTTFNVEPADPDPQIEEWVGTVVKTQLEIMKTNKAAAAVPAPEEEAEDSGEDDDYVTDSIKIEEEEIEDFDMDNVSSELLSEAIHCKHCQVKFTKWRGFKRHVQLKHLKRLRFLCPYCDRSSNSEAVMLQHLRSKHKDKPEKVTENQNPQAEDLNAEFWEREYGLFVPKRNPSKKRKRADEGSVSITQDGQINELPCNKCDFTALNITGLKNHMRTHETKVKQKCTYCTFSSFNSTEMRQHWEVNHSHLDFKVEEAIVTSAAMDVAALRVGKKAKFDDEKKAIVYFCHYCHMCNESLEKIRSHWQSMHASYAKTSVFKYTEHTEVKIKCAYCAESGTKSTLMHHIREKHGIDKPLLMVEREEDGWMCDECKEFLGSKEEIEEHNNRVHPEYTINVKIMRRSFVCKQCGFDTISYETMLRHAKSHLNLYRCKYCSEMFKSYATVKSHFKSAHADKEPETRTLTTEDQNRLVDNLMRDSVVISQAHLSPVKMSQPPVRSCPTSPRLAKKSTTKQSVKRMMWPTPKKTMAVARKSTNPLPRYPPGIVFHTEEKPEPVYFSYYGRPASPVDLGKYYTTLNSAGLKIRMDCAKFAELSSINFDPKLELIDFRKKVQGRKRS